VAALSWELSVVSDADLSVPLSVKWQSTGNFTPVPVALVWHSMYLLLMSKTIWGNNWLNLTELLPLKLLVRKSENLHQDYTLFEHLLSEIQNLLTKHRSGGHIHRAVGAL